MTELITCSAIVVVALVAEHIRWLHTAKPYPTLRCSVYLALACLVFLFWIGVPWEIVVGTGALIINATASLWVVRRVSAWWVLVRAERAAKRRADELEEILLEFISLTPEPDYDTLVVWIARYPQYKQELIDFGIAHAILEALPPAPIDDDASARLAGYGRVVFKHALEGR